MTQTRTQRWKDLNHLVHVVMEQDDDSPFIIALGMMGVQDIPHLLKLDREDFEKLSVPRGYCNLARILRLLVYWHAEEGCPINEEDC